MRLLQEVSQPFEIAILQRIYKCVHPRDLGIHVAAPIRLAGLGLAAPLVVGRACKRAVLAGVDHCDEQVVRKGNRLVLESPAVEQKRVAAPAHCCGELVHDAHLDSGGAMLRALARERRLDAIHLRLEPGGYGYKQRRR